MYVHNAMYMIVCLSVIHNIPKLETIQMSMERQMDMQDMICLYSGILVNQIHL
jgi:hypothetical protein